jgi:hypothetical protein
VVSAMFFSIASAPPIVGMLRSSPGELNPWTEARADTENPQRGPLLIISGEKDNSVP